MIANLGADVRSVGVAYAEQVIEHVPTDAFDRRVEFVVTERALFGACQAHVGAEVAACADESGTGIRDEQER